MEERCSNCDTASKQIEVELFERVIVASVPHYEAHVQPYTPSVHRVTPFVPVATQSQARVERIQIGCGGGKGHFGVTMCVACMEEGQKTSCLRVG